MLEKRIENFLNSGDTVVAELAAPSKDIRIFVCIRPKPKPGVPREERRYLNSRWSIWEYWNFSFRKLTLKNGWQEDDWNYDLYIVSDEQRVTVNASEFEQAIADWVPSPSEFRHCTESDYPG
jgi:hypothetical protein